MVIRLGEKYRHLAGNAKRYLKKVAKVSAPGGSKTRLNRLQQLQQVLGNQTVQKLVQAPSYNNINPLSSQTSQFQRGLGSIGEGTPAKTSATSGRGTLKARPTKIEKTEVETQKLHFGARYKHTLKSSDGKMEGIHVTEKVTKVKDDFKTGLKGVERGKHIAVINSKNEISDKIWTSFGAIAPAIGRLREKMEPTESLLGTMEDHQELYYWENRKPVGWKKFTDVKIEQRLYDLPGLVLVTIDNGVMAEQENFTPFAPRKEKHRQIQNAQLDHGNHDFSGNQVLQRQLATAMPDVGLNQEYQPLLQRQIGSQGEQKTVAFSDFVFTDAPVIFDPTESRLKPLVSSKTRWPLPPVGSDYSWRFWHPNLQFRIEQNGIQTWWEDHLQKDGTWYRSLWQFNPVTGDWQVGGYVLTPAPKAKSAPEEETESQIQENPKQLDLNIDPEILFGPRIATQQNVTIMGWESSYVELFLDRTIVLYPKDGSPPIYFLHHPGGSANAFEFYNQQGRKTIIIMPIEIEKIFGRKK
jgi:hypothetical protein